MKAPVVCSAAAFALALASCGALDQRVAESAAEGGEVGSTESALLAAASEGADLTMTPEDAAANAEAMAPAQYDMSCLTVTVDGATVTYVFDACTGPYGLVTVTGTVVVVFSATALGLVANLTSTGLDVNGGIYDVAALGLLTAMGTTRTLDVTTDTNGTTPRGRKLERAGDYTVTVDDAARCVRLDGNWETILDERDGWDTDVAALRKCENACPDAGGTIVLTGRRRGNTITVSFDGSEAATWEASTGTSGTVDLACL